MRVSWKWLSELVDLKDAGGPEGLAELLTRRGLEVESLERQDHGFAKVVVAQILEKKPHPQADRLSLCKVTVGTGEPLDIVCGAQNMKAGDKVALAQIGAELPNGLKIAQGKIRGETSNGMLCSEEELKTKDKSEGILILPPATPLGKPLAEVLGRDDTVLVLKLTANRGDCLSHYGLAREVAAALGKKAKRPEATQLAPGKCPISIALEAGDLAPQFWGAVIDGVKIGPSPDWVVKRLETLGSRSINNVVDATNLTMLELGNPTHAYDAGRIEGGKIGVRTAKKDEELPLLDGATVKLAGTELVIFDGKRAVGLAGVMGGGNSEVQPGTTRVFLECAEFNPSLTRRSASKHLRRTEAAQRFEKGIDPNSVPYAISRLVKLVTEFAGGKVTSTTAAFLPTRDPAEGAPLRKIEVDPAYFSKFLGMAVDAALAEKILKDLDCAVEKKGSSWTVTVPSYRLDLNLPEDLAEEIARTLGYDKIPATIPPLTSQPTSLWAAKSMLDLALINRAKDVLVESGLNETLNFSFTSKAWLSQFGMTSSALVTNPISEECEAMVPSLIPGLIKNITDNWSHHFGSEVLPIRLFEIRPTFSAPGPVAAKGETETGAVEKWKLAIAISGPRYASGLRNEIGEVDFFDLKAVIENLFESLGTKGVRMQPLSVSRTGGNPLFHPGQSVEILAGAGAAGTFGLLHPGMARQFKMRAPIWLAEIEWEPIAKLSRSAVEMKSFKSWSEFPSMERDFALVVKDDISADKITQLAIKSGKPLAKVAKIFDIYKGSQVSQGMTSVAVRVIFYDESRSIQESETEAASARILEAWKKDLGVELRS